MGGGGGGRRRWDVVYMRGTVWRGMTGKQTFEFGKILFIDAAAHILMLLMLMTVAVAAAVVHHTAVSSMRMTVGVGLNTGIVGQPPFLAVRVEAQPVPGVGVRGVGHRRGAGRGDAATAAAPSRHLGRR